MSGRDAAAVVRKLVGVRSVQERLTELRDRLQEMGCSE